MSLRIASSLLVAAFATGAGASAFACEPGDHGTPPRDDDPGVTAPSPADPVTADGEANLSLLPRKLDGSYRYNANAPTALTTYLHPDGTERQLIIFHADDRRTHVAERRFPDGQWGSAVDVHGATNSSPLEMDSHNAPAIGVAPDGTIFAVGGHHVDPLAIARSVEPWNAGAFVNVPRSELGARDTDRVTYPSFFTANNRLHLSYREQEVGANRQFRWLIKTYDHESGLWSTFVQLDDSQDTRLYVSKIATSRDRGEIHLSAVWRDEHPSIRRNTYTQADLFHLYFRDGQWQQLGAGPVSPPFAYTHGTRSSDVPVNIWDTPSDPEPRSAGSVLVDRNGTVHIVTRDRQRGVWYHRGTESGWDSRKLQVRSQHEILVEVGDRVALILASDGDIVYQPLDGTPWRLLAEGYTSERHARISLDREAMRRGWLSLLLTDFRHGPPRSYNGPAIPEEGQVLSIPLDELATFDQPWRE